MATVCAVASWFVSVTATVKPDGAEIVGGESVPPDPISYIAGMRARLGAGGEVLFDPGAGFGIVVELVLVLVLVLVEAVVVVLGEAVVEARVVVLVDDVLAEPPHPTSRRTESSPRTFLRQLTSAA